MCELHHSLSDRRLYVKRQTLLVLLLLLLLKLWQCKSLFNEVANERVSLVFEGVSDTELRDDDLR